MKKKMSVLVALVMAVAVTSYSVSGTYAKYTSNIDLTDEARVAKWDFYARDGGNCTKVEGVYNEQTGQNDGVRWECAEATNLNLFADSYSIDSKGLYVKSFDGDKVVAPGTEGTYAIRYGGAMEVRHNFNVNFEVVDNKQVAVSFNRTANGLEIFNDTTTGANVYSPIVYTIHMYGNGIDKTFTGSLEEIQTALSTWNASSENDFVPGRLGMALDISWNWKAENDGYVTSSGLTLTKEEADELDTHIGKNWSVIYGDAQNDLGAESTYKLSVSATQIAENYSHKG